MDRGGWTYFRSSVRLWGVGYSGCEEKGSSCQVSLSGHNAAENQVRLEFEHERRDKAKHHQRPAPPSDLLPACRMRMNDRLLTTTGIKLFIIRSGRTCPSPAIPIPALAVP